MNAESTPGPKPVNPRKILLPARVLSQLGKAPDAELARRHGVSLHAVKTHRIAAGIPAAPRYAPLPAQVLSQLGKVPDLDLAEQAGVSRAAIVYRRQVLGIGEPPARPKGRKPHSLAPKIINKLGRVPDTHLARDAGVKPRVIYNARRRAGIQSTHSLGGKPRIAVPAVVIRKLGHVPDCALAREYGIDPGVVRQRRLERGIPVASRRRAG